MHFRALLVFSALAATSCRTTTGGSSATQDAGATAAAAGLVSELELYSQPHFGLYFYDGTDVPVLAVAGQPNANFDPAKPTMIYLHGWTPGELTKTTPRSFNYSVAYPHAPNVNLIKVWRDAGWNFGMMDWAQFADTQFETNTIGALPGAKVYDDAERRLWARDDNNQLVYHLSNGTLVNSPEASVAAILAKAYTDFMRNAGYTGGEIRFYGHSLGTQAAIAVADLLYDASQNGSGLPANLLPTRISLTDITSTNCPHPWLPATTTHHRLPTPVCPNPTVAGDWVGERLLYYITAMKTAATPPVFDAYRCWLVSSSGIGGDAVAPVNAQVAFTQMKPDVGILDLNEKHAFCNWNYLVGISLPPPAVVGFSDANNSANKNAATAVDPQANTISCADFDPSQRSNPLPGAPSASATSSFIAQAMRSNIRFSQTAASVGPTPANYQFTCSAR